MCAAAGAQAALHANRCAWEDHRHDCTCRAQERPPSTWAAGDYAAVAELIDDAPPRDLLARAQIEPGLEVLDVATGTGNVAIKAAAAGAQVVGLDLTPGLLETARRRAGRSRRRDRLGRG